MNACTPMTPEKEEERKAVVIKLLTAGQGSLVAALKILELLDAYTDLSPAGSLTPAAVRQKLLEASRSLMRWEDFLTIQNNDLA